MLYAMYIETSAVHVRKTLRLAYFSAIFLFLNNVFLEFFHYICMF